jgi:hypothetical protein
MNSVDDEAESQAIETARVQWEEAIRPLIPPGGLMRAVLEHRMYDLSNKTVRLLQAYNHPSHWIHNDPQSPSSRDSHRMLTQLQRAFNDSTDREWWEPR